MGLFDSLKKVINNADNLKSQFDNVKNKLDSVSQPNAQNTVRPLQKTDPVSSGIKTPVNVIESGNKPSKPSVLREHTFFDGDSEIKMTFKLSGDFIEFDSHADSEATYQYEPDSSADFTEYNENLPYFMLNFENAVYNTVKAYKKNGTAGTEFRKIENGKMLFRTKINYFGQVMVMYGFDRGNSWENNGLCMVYNHDVEGTPLEAKLIAALDEAAMTYTETEI